MARGAPPAPPSRVERLTTEALGAHKLYIARSAPSDRGERARNIRTCCRGCRGGSARPARSRPAVDRAQAARRPAAAGAGGPAALVHVRRRHRRALHDLLLEDQRAGHGAALQGRRPHCGASTGSTARSAMWSAGRPIASGWRRSRRRSTSRSNARRREIVRNPRAKRPPKKQQRRTFGPAPRRQIPNSPGNLPL